MSVVLMSVKSVNAICPTFKGWATIRLILSDTQTNSMKAGRYVYDVEITSPSGEKTRVLEGQVEVTPGVTR